MYVLSKALGPRAGASAAVEMVALVLLMVLTLVLVLVLVLVSLVVLVLQCPENVEQSSAQGSPLCAYVHGPRPRGSPKSLRLHLNLFLIEFYSLRGLFMIY